MEMNAATNKIRVEINPTLWHACARKKIHIPHINSTVYYFPQGHAEHSLEASHADDLPSMPPAIHCTVLGISYMADSDTDEVCLKMTLLPTRWREELTLNEISDPMLPVVFYKRLTQSDTNSGGGLSVPVECANNILPRLDTSVAIPEQFITAKDIHGRSWRFRQVYRGSPKRNLLTNEWSNFVRDKKLSSGDSVLFMRGDDDQILIGIIRCERINRESVTEAAMLASRGQRFEVFYYPRNNTPAFCVASSVVDKGMMIQWCAGMRLKMVKDDKHSDSGTVLSYREINPHRWPGSPWRALQVAWDHAQQNRSVEQVNPWVVIETRTEMEIFPSFTSTHYRLPDNHSSSMRDWINVRPRCDGTVNVQRSQPNQNLELRWNFSTNSMQATSKDRKDSVSPLRLGSGSCRKEENSRRPLFRLFGQSIYGKTEASSPSASNDENLGRNGESCSRNSSLPLDDAQCLSVRNKNKQVVDNGESTAHMSWWGSRNL